MYVYVPFDTCGAFCCAIFFSSHHFFFFFWFRVNNTASILLRHLVKH